MRVVTQIADNRIGKSIEQQGNQKRQTHQWRVHTHYLRVENQQEIIEAIVLHPECNGTEAVSKLG